MDWLLPSEVTASEPLREAVGGHPLVADVLARRGIVEPEEARAFLDPARYKPTPPEALPDLEAAAVRLLEAVRRGERILVWGDFDVDGQTSTALLVDALRILGASVEYHIPLRLTHGHGVQTEVLRDNISRGVQVVLTCDTGVDAHEAAEIARAAGVTLLITDHHALPARLPDASAVVNPQRLPMGHPLRDLPGVGVAYKLVEGLYALAGRAGEDRRFLDLAALGIVADVATQRHDTRYLLQMGIEALRYPQRIGLQALMRSAQVDPSNLSADTIGYQVGPRLNALGRLDDARLAVELLTTTDETRALQIAAQLELFNARRKQIEDQIYAAAQEQIVRDPSLLNFNTLVLDALRWHPGVIGIVAARLAEQYERPVVLLVTAEGQPARGSARSVTGVDIAAAIAANAHLLMEHGGHPGAAGLTLDPDLIPQFRRQLSNTVRETRNPDAVPRQAVDAVVSLGDVTMELAEELNRLAPFGEGNPPVALMIPAVRLVSHATFGVNGRHRRLTVEDGEGVSVMLTWWRGSEYPLPGEAFDLLLIPRIHDYKGSRSLQLEWLDSRPLPGAGVEAGPRYQLVDLRSKGQKAEDSIPTLGDYTVWVEAMTQGDQIVPEPEKIGDRWKAQPSPVLVIWTLPPGPRELEQMLEMVKPHTIYVLDAYRNMPDPRTFMDRLTGYAKYALRVYGGEVSVVHLAALTGQREITVRRGLEWLAAKGEIGIEWLDGDRARLSAGGTPDNAAVEPLRDAISALLAETAAYRAYFRQADLTLLFRD